ncbi:MAG: RrF2 family transcriptional regulator [Atribacterota bacterium]|nr:RrF2 family transcriptional regulator [Atribacterota bacterium]
MTKSLFYFSIITTKRIVIIVYEDYKMRLSTRSRYGTRLMLELAFNYNKGNTSLKDIAKKEGISEKYLGQLVIPLKSRGLIISSRGANGGYRLAKNPSLITIKEIVQALEGSVNLVECVNNPSVCKRTSNCPVRNVWEMIDEQISKTLSSISLEDLVSSRLNKAKIKEYV